MASEAGMTVEDLAERERRRSSAYEAWTQKRRRATSISAPSRRESLGGTDPQMGGAQGGESPGRRLSAPTRRETLSPPDERQRKTSCGGEVRRTSFCDFRDRKPSCGDVKERKPSLSSLSENGFGSSSYTERRGSYLSDAGYVSRRPSDCSSRRTSDCSRRTSDCSRRTSDCSRRTSDCSSRRPSDCGSRRPSICVYDGKRGSTGGIRRGSVSGYLQTIDFIVPRRVSGPPALNMPRTSSRASSLDRHSSQDSDSPSQSRTGSFSYSPTQSRTNSRTGNTFSSPLVERCGSDSALALKIDTESGVEVNHWRSRVKALRTRLGTFLKRLGSPRPAPSIGGRALKVEGSRLGRRKSSGADGSEEGAMPGLKNLSPALLVRSLLDGMICAELPLDGVPNGELIIKVKGNKLLLLTRPRPGKSSPLTPNCFVEMPIFVDFSTLDFELEPEPRDILIIRALLKGATTERRQPNMTSSSSTMTKSASHPLLRMAPGNKSRKTTSATSQQTVVDSFQPKRDGRAHSR